MTVADKRLIFNKQQTPLLSISPTEQVVIQLQNNDLAATERHRTSSMERMPSRERSMRKRLNSAVLSYWYWRTRLR